MRNKLYKLLNYFNFFYKLKPQNKLRVLAYHTVPDRKSFEKQLEFLKREYSLIDIYQLIAHLEEDEPLPPKPVLITFDDGDITVLHEGLPALKRFSVPAVVFIISGLINTTNMFWCRWVEEDFEARGKSYSEARKMVNHLKRVSETERRKYLDKLQKIESEQLSSQDLKKLSQNNVFIGNHTHTHPMINKCTEDQLRNELKSARECFREWEMEGYSVFAYPNGNWDKVSEEILKSEGIKLAFLFDHKINNRHINPLRISRIKVDSYTELEEFKTKVSGLHSKIMDLKNILPLTVS